MIIQMPQGLRNSVGFLLHFGGKFNPLFPVLFRKAFLSYQDIKNYTRLCLISVLAYTRRKKVRAPVSPSILLTTLMKHLELLAVFVQELCLPVSLKN